MSAPQPSPSTPPFPPYSPPRLPLTPPPLPMHSSSFLLPPPPPFFPLLIDHSHSLPPHQLSSSLLLPSSPSSHAAFGYCPRVLASKLLNLPPFYFSQHFPHLSWPPSLLLCPSHRTPLVHKKKHERLLLHAYTSLIQQPDPDSITIRSQRDEAHTRARTIGSPQQVYPPAPTPQLALRLHPAGSHSEAHGISNHL